MTNTAEVSPDFIADSGALSREDFILRSKPLSLKRNAIWTIFGNGAYALAQWLQIALIAHLGTSVDVGHYALAMGICAPVFMLFNLQLRQVQATDSMGRNTFPEYLGLRVLSSLFSLGVACVLAVVTSGNAAVAGLTILVAGFKGVESISDIYQGLLQQQERMDYVGRSLIFKSVLILTAFGGTYSFSHSLAWSVTAMLVAQIASLLLYDIYASYRAVFNAEPSGWINAVCAFCPSFHVATLKRLTVRVLPLGITMMLWALYANLPRFVLSRYLGASSVGVFAAISYIPLVSGLLVTSLGTAVAPRLARHAATDRKQFYKLLMKLSLFAFALGSAGILGSVFLGRTLLSLLYGIEYARNADVLVWLMVATAFTYLSSSFGFAATAQGRFTGQPWIVAIAVALLLGTAMILVPRYGLTGAAMATVVSSISCLCGYLVLTLGVAR